MINEDNTRIIVTISKELKKQLEDAAKKDSRSLSSLMNKIAKDFIEGK